MRGTCVDLARASNARGWILVHFGPMRDPTGQSSDSEQYGEHLHGESHGAVDHAGVEIDIGV